MTQNKILMSQEVREQGEEGVLTCCHARERLLPSNAFSFTGDLFILLPTVISIFWEENVEKVLHGATEAARIRSDRASVLTFAVALYMYRTMTPRAVASRESQLVIRITRSLVRFLQLRTNQSLGVSF